MYNNNNNNNNNNSNNLKLRVLIRNLQDEYLFYINTFTKRSLKPL